MAKARRTTPPTAAHHHPSISPEMALKKLQKLLEQIPQIRSGGDGSAGFSTWEKNVKIVLAEFYGESSLIFKQFSGISFSPGMYYAGQPQSDFVEAFNSGLDEATGFLPTKRRRQ